MRLVLIGLSHHAAPWSCGAAGPGGGAAESLLAALAAKRLGRAGAGALQPANRDGRWRRCRARGHPGRGGRAHPGGIVRARQRGRSGAAGCLYRYDGDEAVRRMFRVASSLDSMLPGGPRILGQVKESLEAVGPGRSSRPDLEALMQRVFADGAPRARRHAHRARPVSIAYAAAEFARTRIFGSSLSARRGHAAGSRHMAAGLAPPQRAPARIRSTSPRAPSPTREPARARAVNGIPVRSNRFKETLDGSGQPGLVRHLGRRVHLRARRRRAPDAAERAGRSSSSTSRCHAT